MVHLCGDEGEGLEVEDEGNIVHLYKIWTELDIC